MGATGEQRRTPLALLRRIGDRESLQAGSVMAMSRDEARCPFYVGPSEEATDGMCGVLHALDDPDRASVFRVCRAARHCFSSEYVHCPVHAEFERLAAQVAGYLSKASVG